MSAPKHTPGPWHVQPSRIHPMIVSHNGTYIAPVRFSAWERLDGRNATEVANARAECNANAALIAAAPDLLEQLKDMTESFRSIYTSEYGTDKEADEHTADARAAIAKAEGRTP